MLLPHYQPQSEAEWHNFFSQNAWLYAVFMDIVKVTEGQRFVLQEKEQSNAYRVLKKLQRFAQTSTHAKLHAQSLLNTLNTAMCNSRSTQLAIEIIDNFLQKVEEYNELQTDRTCCLTDGQIQRLSNSP